MKSYTDTDQSITLSKILPLESADMYYPCEGVSPKFGVALSISNNIPCWSLAALRNLLPPAIKPNKDSCLFLFESHNAFDKSWVYRYYNEDDTSYLYYKNTNEVDACVEMIIKLHELNLL